MRANVKPLVHWAIYKDYTLRFYTRTPARVTGRLTRSDGPVDFVYEPESYRIHLPEGVVQINEYGWEVDDAATDRDADAGSSPLDHDPP